MFTLVSTLFALSLLTSASNPSPAQRQHRILTLSRIVKPLHRMDDIVAPDFSFLHEILRDWLRAHPNEQSRFDDLFSRYLEYDQAYQKLRESDASDREIFANLDQSYRLWDELRDLPAEAPWDTLSWARVFAGQIADLEVRLAERWGVDLARVQQLMEHALPDADGACGSAALVRAVDAGFSPATKPLYCDRLVDALVEEAAGVSKILSLTIAQENLEVSDRSYPMTVIQNELFRPRFKLEYTKNSRARLARLRMGFESLDQSRRRNAILIGIDNCERELSKIDAPSGGSK